MFSSTKGSSHIIYYPLSLVRKFDELYRVSHRAPDADKFNVALPADCAPAMTSLYRRRGPACRKERMESQRVALLRLVLLHKKIAKDEVFGTILKSDPHGGVVDGWPLPANNASTRRRNPQHKKSGRGPPSPLFDTRDMELVQTDKDSTIVVPPIVAYTAHLSVSVWSPGSGVVGDGVFTRVGRGAQYNHRRPRR